MKDWVAGRICFGSWVDHLRSWLDPEIECLEKVGLDPRVLVVSFEEMKISIESVVMKVAAHLRVELSDEQISFILPRLSFEHMKANINKYQPRSVQWLEKNDSFAFVRKGEIGDSRRLFTDEHEELFREYLRDKRIPKACLKPTL